jgi:hypothetical protein
VRYYHFSVAVSEFRQLKCATLDGQLRAGPDTAHCHLILKDVEEESPGRPAPEGDGCFTVSCASQPPSCLEIYFEEFLACFPSFNFYPMFLWFFV